MSSITTPYGFGVKVALPWDAAVQRTTELLKEEGFGILTRIDVQQTLQEKLGVGFRRYVILGACNPPLAHRAFQAELNIGLLLPCNVAVYEDEGGSVVAFMDPAAAMGFVGNDALTPVAEEARARLLRVRDRLAGGVS
jgi:uncharacterized protein (DUF302 family)